LTNLRTYSFDRRIHGIQIVEVTAENQAEAYRLAQEDDGENVVDMEFWVQDGADLELRAIYDFEGNEIEEVQ